MTLTGHEGIVHGVGLNFHHGKRHVISGSSDKNVKVWDLTTGRCIRTLAQHDNTVCSVVVAGGFIYSGSFAEIKIWDGDTYQEVTTLRGHNHWVRAIVVRDGVLYSGSYNAIMVS
jgi:WD40 repeat protein